MHIFGANNFGKELIEYIDFNRYPLVHVLDTIPGIELAGLRFSVKYNPKLPSNEGLVIAVKDNRERKKIARGMKVDELTIFWDKSARRGDWPKVQWGCIILQDVVICPGAKIGWHTILNKNA
jgi:hypothetical protein